jgi:D-alanyl-D-alanine carboxypeptidase
LRAVLFLLTVFFFSFQDQAFARYASMVIEAETGNILQANNPDKINHPASLTKMMTLHMIFDALDKGQIRLDQKVPRLPLLDHAARAL